MKRWVVVTVVTMLALSGCVSIKEMQQKAAANAMGGIEAKTGLKEVKLPDTQQQYLGKTHRGYPVLFTGQAGNVWGRYAARMAIGEIGREVGGIMSFLTGSYKTGGDAAGSIMDRLLAKAIGQPISITMILKHDKENVPRLDVLSSYSTIKPEDALPSVAKVGFGAGSVMSNDKAFAGRVTGNQALMARMKKLRSQYIRVDEGAVTFVFSGQETDYSAIIREHGGYENMLNALMDDLADIADAIDGKTAAERKAELAAAKAEAEAAKARVEAENAKAEAAKIKAEAEAAVAGTKADAGAAMSAAEGDAAKAKADADALKARAEEEAAKAGAAGAMNVNTEAEMEAIKARAEAAAAEAMKAAKDTPAPTAE